jgi:hypothetical protein
MSELDEGGGSILDTESRFDDEQILALAAMSFVVLIIIIFLILSFTNNLSTANAALKTAVNATTAQFNARFPAIVSQLEESVVTIQAICTETYNSVNDQVVLGVQKTLNVITSVGSQVLDTMTTALKNFLDILNQIGADTLVFFSNSFQPLVKVAQISGEVIIDSLTVLQAVLTPIITLISVLVDAINAIGQKF